MLLSDSFTCMQVCVAAPMATEKLNNEKIEKLIGIECEILTQSMECECNRDAVNKSVTILGGLVHQIF